jgi:hypothetical protein
MISPMAEQPEYPYEPGKRLFMLDLDAYEQMMFSYIEITTLGDFDRRIGFTEGFIFSANRGAHGGDLHVTREHLIEIRDAIDRVLKLEESQE